MTKEQFDHMVERLKYWNKGDGVHFHCTANPIFEVKEKHRIFGLDSEYTDERLLVETSSGYDDEWANPADFISDLDEDRNPADRLWPVVGLGLCDSPGNTNRFIQEVANGSS